MTVTSLIVKELKLLLSVTKREKSSNVTNDPTCGVLNRPNAPPDCLRKLLQVSGTISQLKVAKLDL